jgi:4-hydroxy-tetrahydrodipicolinate reductase
MKLNVCVAGASGWVGNPLSKAIAQSADLGLVGAVARTHKGKRLSDVIGALDSDVSVSGSVDEALAAPTDVLVDYTKPNIVKANVLAAIRRGVHVVIGTSGLTDDDYAEIHQAAVAHKVGVVAAGNFAITVVLLQRFACEAAKYLSHWEIIDYASDAKIDAPSGTARELAFRLSEIKQPELTVPLDKMNGPRDSRGTTLNGTQVHSVRVPSFVIGVEAIFGAKQERLSLRHDAGSGADPYIQGTLLAIRKVKSVSGLVRGLDRVMD